MSLSSPVLGRECAPASRFAYMTPGARALAELDTTACHWPLGVPAEPGFAFCGGPRLTRGPYCAVHAAMARAGGPSAGFRAEALS